MARPLYSHWSWRLALAACALVACGSNRKDGVSVGDASTPPEGSSMRDASEPADANRAGDGGRSSDGAQPADAGDDGSSAADSATATIKPSAGCARAPAYAAGTSIAMIAHASATRSFRVHIPDKLTQQTASPLVLMFHGGGGSGSQFENNSARMDEVADREGFITVYPDGSGVLRTWNGGGCCGYAVSNDVDDVGFVAALLDHLTSSLCIDERRIYASGMSNGGILTHRLGCELSERFAAIAPVAGTMMVERCAPARKLPVLHVHGSADGHVPWDGGEGCGPAGVTYRSVPDTIARWTAANGCGRDTRVWLERGDGRCETQLNCAEGASVVLCRIEGGGHNWPGGDPPAGLVECPGNGGQSSSFSASEVIWRFFQSHARRD